MYSGYALARHAAAAATVTSAILILPHSAGAQLIHNEQLLTKGMRHDAVKTVQSILNSVGGSKVKANGYFGNTTVQAVRHFQQTNGLQADGVVGSQTKRALIGKMAGTFGLLSAGSKGEAVKYLQDYLKRFGYYPGKIDGLYGPLTRRAVLAVQKETSIRTDGIAGPETWRGIAKLDEGKRVENKRKSVRARRQSTAPVPKARAAVSAPRPHSVAAPKKANTAVREFYVSSTAYTAYCSGCSGTTATGINLKQRPNAKVVAVDPSVIPLGTKLHVEGYGYAVAGDTGGAIKGRKIDVFFKDNGTALKWGRRTVKVRILH
ncbi:MAG: peptidoglycan-binding protein [Sporolactobacillus sp.]|jgi:3D (Asp-Asp-Asp) domain-containing protein|nr:peptidoglycan-binding protein [Sporolactobacillus sp.]MCI1882512.1 peptidoglycan-binding protein [Sporolactobacillus sp.]